MPRSTHPGPAPVPVTPATDRLPQFSARGRAALDELAAVITHRMATTPDGIARALAMAYRTPLTELLAAFDAIAARLAAEQATGYLCTACRDGRHTACEDAEHDRGYRSCCCQHRTADPADTPAALPGPS